MLYKYIHIICIYIYSWYKYLYIYIYIYIYIHSMDSLGLPLFQGLPDWMLKIQPGLYEQNCTCLKFHSLNLCLHILTQIDGGFCWVNQWHARRLRAGLLALQQLPVDALSFQLHADLRNFEINGGRWIVLGFGCEGKNMTFSDRWCLFV